MLVQQNEDVEPWKSITDAEARTSFLKELHEMKTDIFNQLIETGKLPVRPGVIRLIGASVLVWGEGGRGVHGGCSCAS